MNWRTVAGGVLALIILETVVQQQAANRVGGIFSTIANGFARFLDPNLPAIPDLNPPPGQQDQPGSTPAPSAPSTTVSPPPGTWSGNPTANSLPTAPAYASGGSR